MRQLTRANVKWSTNGMEYWRAFNIMHSNERQLSRNSRISFAPPSHAIYILSIPQTSHITVHIKQSQSSPPHPQPKQGLVVAPLTGFAIVEVAEDVDVAGAGPVEL